MSQSQTHQVPPVPFEVVVHDLMAALDRAAAASLASGIIGSSGQAHTPAQAAHIRRHLDRLMLKK